MQTCFFMHALINMLHLLVIFLLNVTIYFELAFNLYISIPLQQIQPLEYRAFHRRLF